MMTGIARLTRPSLRRAGMVAAAVACAGTAFATAAPAASAQASANQPTLAAAGGNRFLDCDFKLDIPHYSGHNPGNVSSTARIDCRSPKNGMHIGVNLLKMTDQPAQNPQQAGAPAGAKYLQAASNLPCQQGEVFVYGATADFSMTGPDGKVYTQRQHLEASVQCSPDQG